jgi:hypothetical protein
MKEQLPWLVIFVCYGAHAQGTPGVSTEPATLSNKTISGANNTLSNIGPSSVLTYVGSYLAIGGTADDTAVV